MVATDSEMISQGEVQSSLKQEQQEAKNHALQSLGRQSSIYSLTLDEFQHTLCEGGKNFGSMNMDEFLNSIWTAEEHQAQAQGQANTAPVTTDNYNNPMQFSVVGDSTTSADDQHKGIVKQPSLSRQGSLTLPPPLCRKTVDEVWAEIHKTQQDQRLHNTNGGNVQNPSSTQSQPTFGEMTLEDFLIRAGVVREQDHPPPPPSQPQPYGMYQNGQTPLMGAPFVSRPVMPIAGATASSGPGPGVNVPAAYQPFPQSSAAEASGYPGGMKRVGVYAQQPAVVYGGRVAGNGAYGQVQDMAMGSPVSPVSSDGLCASQIDGNPYGLDMGGARGSRKRIIDGPIEKVVERRQRRMIKNRESAARSRARKQAYTVELEAELNQLKEENAHLKQALAEMERKRKQQYFEEVKMKVQSKAQKAHERLRVIRRTLSCP